MQKELFYCKGSKENPEGVKAALIAKGGRYPGDFDFDNEDNIYFILDGVIQCTCKDCIGASFSLIKEYGTEIQPIVEETFKPFDRVIVADRYNEWRVASYFHKSRVTDSYCCSGLWWEYCHHYEDWMEKYLGTATPFEQFTKE